MIPPLVAVVGKGRDCPQAVYDAAREIGAAVADANAILVTGGLGGVMEAAAAGCQAAGGFVVGVIPQQYKGNSHLSLALRTGLPEPVRNVITANCCQAMLVLPGSHGTLQEAVVALDRNIPVGLVGVAGVPHLAWMDGLLGMGTNAELLVTRDVEAWLKDHLW
jgi:uncharacterized protein (TIGR00725 family)